MFKFFLFCFLTSLITFVIVCREGERTLKLRFLSPKSFDFYLKQICFLYFSIYVFFVSHNTKAYMFFSQPLLHAEKVEEHTITAVFIWKTPQVRVHFLCFFGLWLNFFIFVSSLKRVHSFLYPFFWGFMIFCKTKALIFFGCFPFILFSEFSHYKKFNFFYFVFWLLIILLESIISLHKEITFLFYIFFWNHNFVVIIAGITWW